MAQALIPVGRLQVATPLSMALAVRQPTDAQAAVDERINTQVAPLVAQAIADDPTVAQAASDAAEAAVDEVLIEKNVVVHTDPGIPTAGSPDVWTFADARRRRLFGIQIDGQAFAVAGVNTPHAGVPIPAGAPVIAGTFDAVRRRWCQDAIGLDGRLLDSTIASIADRIGSGSLGTKRAPHVLTCPGDQNADTATSRTVRWPVKMPAAAADVVLKLRNRNDRDSIVYPGVVTVTGVWWGVAARGADGQMTGGFAAAPVQVAAGFTTPANGDGVSIPLNLPSDIEPGVDYLLSIGYTCAAQDNHLAQGGGWWNSDAANANQQAPALTQTKRTPFSVWLDCQISAGVKLVAWIGDSLTVGTQATFPVYDSAARQHAFEHGVWPVMYAHHGSTMAKWRWGDAERWTMFGNPQCDAILWAIGSNDVFDGIALAGLQDRFVQLWATATAQIGTKRVFIATVMPRGGAATTPAKETVRLAYNAYLFGRPMGALGVFDFAASIEGAPDTIRDIYDCGDHIHLTTAGYAHNALSITSALTN